jgi:hypothetical protein
MKKLVLFFALLIPVLGSAQIETSEVDQFTGDVFIASEWERIGFPAGSSMYARCIQINESSFLEVGLVFSNYKITSIQEDHPLILLLDNGDKVELYPIKDSYSSKGVVDMNAYTLVNQE